MPSGFSGALDNTPTSDDCAVMGSATNVEDVNCAKNYGSICEINVVDFSAIKVRT